MSIGSLFGPLFPIVLPDVLQSAHLGWFVLLALLRSTQIKKKLMEIKFWNRSTPHSLAITRADNMHLYISLLPTDDIKINGRGWRVFPEWGPRRFLPLGKTFMCCGSVDCCCTEFTNFVSFWIVASICWILKPLLFTFRPIAICWVLIELKCCPSLWGEEIETERQVWIWLLQLESYGEKSENEMQNMEWIKITLMPITKQQRKLDFKGKM